MPCVMAVLLSSWRVDPALSVSVINSLCFLSVFIGLRLSLYLSLFVSLSLPFYVLSLGVWEREGSSADDMNAAYVCT